MPIVVVDQLPVSSGCLLAYGILNLKATPEEPKTILLQISQIAKSSN